MAEETERLHASPDLVDRVVGSSRRKRTMSSRLTVAAAAMAVVGIAAPTYLVLGPGGHGPASGTPVTAETLSADAADRATPEPYPTQSPEPLNPFKGRSLGDLGDGRVVGRVKVGYLPKGLRWSDWSLDFGAKYTTSYDFDGADPGAYSVQLYIYEGATAKEPEDRMRKYREAGDGKDVTVGGKTSYLLRQWVGEDGGKGTPTLYVRLGADMMVEVMISPGYAKRLGGEKAIERQLKKIGAGLSAKD
jgi:hypothetical protein